MTVQLFMASDLTQLARTVDIWTIFWLALYKWCFILIFNEDFAKFNTLLVQVHSQGSVVYSQLANRFTSNYLKPGQKVSTLYMFTGIISSILIVLSPLVTYPKGERSELDYFNDSKSYPIGHWIPFTVKEKWMFSLIFVCQCIAGILIIVIYFAVDSFMFGAIYMIGSQIELLKLSIIKIETILTSSCTDQLTFYDDNQQDLCYSMLRECALHHILILDYIKYISKMFNSLIIVDYLHGVISMTFALFQLSVCVHVDESIVVVLYIVLSISHQFLNNFFGEFIVEKQLSVYSVLYHVPWWRVDKKGRYLLTFMIWRSIKPTMIIGLYIYKLSYKSFILFVKTFFRLYMILKYIKSKNEIHELSEP